jgi:APA family basic amino acid/polyamine antiporter
MARTLDTTGAASRTQAPRIDLARVLGPWAAAAIVVGTMLGTGIFIVPSTMARQAGSVPLVMTAWVLGGLLALFGALSYAELAAAMPDAGGQYVYLRRAFGERTGFLFGWTHAVLVGPCSGATIATGLVQFAVFLSPGLTAPIALRAFGGASITPAQLWTVVVLIAVGAINYLGVRLGGRLQVGLTTLKVMVLVGIIAIPLFVAPVAAGPGEASSAAAAGTLSGFLAALVGALWAYEGWTSLTYVGSEVVNPQRSIPRALTAGVIGVGLIYILVNVAVFAVIPFGHVVRSSSVVADLVETAAGRGASWWITIAMMLSALGSLNSDTLTNARIPFALARDGLFFRFTARVSPAFRTPGGALLFHTAAGCALALTGTFEELYSLYVFSLWLFLGLAAAAVIVLRRTEPDMPRPYRTWGYPLVPLAFIAGCCALTISLWLARPVRSTIGLALILAGVPVHAWIIRGRNTEGVLH